MIELAALDSAQWQALAADPGGALHPLCGNGSDIAETIAAVAAAQRDFQQRAGATTPWTGHLARRIPDRFAIGSGAFKAPPADRQVEIAYFVVPPFERQGHGTAIARSWSRSPSPPTR